MDTKKISPDELRSIMRQLGYNPTHQGKEFAADLGITNYCLRKWLDKNHQSCLCTEKNGRLTIHGRGLEHLRAERKGKKQVIEKIKCAYCAGEFTEQLTNGNEGGRLIHTCPNGTKTITPFLSKEDREWAVTPMIKGEKKMMMYASRLTNTDRDTTCEKCGKITATFGVVSLRDLENIQSSQTMTRREKVEYLIWHHGIGEILCTKCLKKRIKK